MAATAGSANQFGGARSSQPSEIAVKEADRKVHDNLTVNQVRKESWLEPSEKFVGCPKLVSDRYFRGHKVFVASLLRFSPKPDLRS